MSMSTLRNKQEGLPLVFVEDLVSCIKVSRVNPCVCLFGSHVPLELVIWGLESFKSFSILLDPDKKKEAVKQAINLKQKGIDCKALITCDKDPKECTMEEIKEILK